MNSRMAAFCAAICAATAAAAEPARPTDEKPRLAVLDLDVAGADRAIGRAFAEAIASELGAKDYFSVMSAKDIETLLGRERQKHKEVVDQVAATLILQSFLDRG